MGIGMNKLQILWAGGTVTTGIFSPTIFTMKIRGKCQGQGKIKRTARTYEKLRVCRVVILYRIDKKVFSFQKDLE